MRVCVCVGGAFNDAMGRLGNMGYLEREKGEKESISELKSLILGHRMGINSPGNLKIPCPLADRITKSADLWESSKFGNGFGLVR